MQPTRPLAAIDTGSNTIHLTVARPTADGRSLDYVADTLELVRIGADVSATGAIGAERMARAVSVIATQAERARALGATAVIGIATEGIRAAGNADAFIQRVAEEAGVVLRVISGDQEAALTYWGATSDMTGSDARVAVVDLGGGSVEVVVGEATHVLWRVSLPLGSGTLHDRFTRSDPPTEAELRAVGDFVDAALGGLGPPLPVKEVRACGGTATTLAGLSLALSGPEHPEATRLSGLTPERMRAALDLMRAEPASEVARRFGLEIDRARILPAGTTILVHIMRWLDTDILRVTGRGIREGALLAYLHAGERWPELAEAGAGW